VQSLGFVSRANHRDRIVADLRSTRDVGDELAVRSAKLKLAIRQSIDPIALFVDGAMVATAQPGEI